MGGEGFMDSIFQYLISCTVLELKLYTLYLQTEKPHFSTVANILKISVRGFFANLIICP
jgi:hypothetical protein